MLELFHSPPTMCWLALLIGSLVLEGLTSTLVCLWFGVGSLAALLLSLCTENLWVQSFTFAILSLVTLLFLRPVAKRTLIPKGPTATNADRLIGRNAIVTETIDEVSGSGQVKVSGLTWTARTVDGSVLPPETRVVIRSIEGVKLMVEAAANEVHTS